jgi:hypothetical protein
MPRVVNVYPTHIAKSNFSTPEGKMLFQLFAMIAGIERDYIVRRHTAGRMNQWRGNRWIPIAVPQGYKLDEDGRMTVDEESVAKVRSMLQVLANRALTATETVKTLGALGITSAKIKENHGEDATIADVRNPSEAISTLVGWIDTYRTGQYTVDWPNPFSGVDEVAGVSVEVDDPKLFPKGVLRLEFKLPLPEGAWADESTLDAIELRRYKKATITGASAHKKVGPLSGLFHFTEDGYEYAITGERYVYVLLRRIDDPKRRRFGWNSNVDGNLERVATINRIELHKSIANGVASAVANGLPAELDVGRFNSQSEFLTVDANSSLLQGLRRQLCEAEKQRDRAHRNARQAGDDEASQFFVDDVKRYAAEIRQLTDEIAECERAKVKPVLGSTFETNASMVAYAMSALANSERLGGQEVRQALRTVISDETMTFKDKCVTWSLNLELSHPEGTILLGPITGTVATGMRKMRTKASSN